MDPTLAQRILQDRRTAFVLTDRELVVTDLGGVTGLLQPDTAGWRGRPLPDLVPELVGSEAALADVLAGDLPRLEMAWINREQAGGQTLYLTMVILPHHDEQGQIAGLLYLVDDCSDAGTLRQHLSQSHNELRLAQEQLTRQNRELAATNVELRRLSDLKSTFVSVAAHELRTPLTVIQGYLELVMDEEVGPLNATQREYLTVVESSAQGLLHITRSLLDVTRIEAGRVDLVLQPTDLAELVRRVAAAHEPQVRVRAQNLTIQHPPGLPWALCDQARTGQILGNLLGNAIKYTPPQGNIRISLAPAQEEGFLQLTVADDGVGIEPEDQDQLFKRFFRATNATRTGASGAGLGLYITRALVELHGGRIWLESAVNQGSTFYVTLPTAE